MLPHWKLICLNGRLFRVGESKIFSQSWFANFNSRYLALSLGILLFEAQMIRILQEVSTMVESWLVIC